jgi:acyl CoA:acetate/3-ketoacid CoA transferase alpha subunit
MAKAAKVTIAEVEEIVEVGELDPNFIHLPGIYVDRLVKVKPYEKFIEVDDLFPVYLNLY